MPNSWKTVINYMEIWLSIHERDMICIDEFMYLYCLKESKQFGYYEFMPWKRKSRVVVNFPSSFCNWKSRYSFISGSGWETPSDEFWGEFPMLLRRWETPILSVLSLSFLASLSFNTYLDHLLFVPFFYFGVIYITSPFVAVGNL